MWGKKYVAVDYYACDSYKHICIYAKYTRKCKFKCIKLVLNSPVLCLQNFCVGKIWDFTLNNNCYTKSVE